MASGKGGEYEIVYVRHLYLQVCSQAAVRRARAGRDRDSSTPPIPPGRQRQGAADLQVCGGRGGLSSFPADHSAHVTVEIRSNVFPGIQPRFTGMILGMVFNLEITNGALTAGAGKGNRLGEGPCHE